MCFSKALSMWSAVYLIKENYQNGCHFQNIALNNKIFEVHLLRVYVQTSFQYDVSMSNSVAR